MLAVKFFYELLNLSFFTCKPKVTLVLVGVVKATTGVEARAASKVSFPIVELQSQPGSKAEVPVPLPEVKDVPEVGGSTSVIPTKLVR